MWWYVWRIRIEYNDRWGVIGPGWDIDVYLHVVNEPTSPRSSNLCHLVTSIRRRVTLLMMEWAEKRRNMGVFMRLIYSCASIWDAGIGNQMIAERALLEGYLKYCECVNRCWEPVSRNFKRFPQILPSPTQRSRVSQSRDKILHPELVIFFNVL